MNCIGCGSAAVTERPDRIAQGYRRFRCRDCGIQFNQRSDGVLNRASLPSDIIAFVVFCRLRYRLTLRDLSEIMLLRGFTISHESIRRWEAKLVAVDVSASTGSSPTAAPSIVARTIAMSMSSTSPSRISITPDRGS